MGKTQCFSQRLILQRGTSKKRPIDTSIPTKGDRRGGMFRIDKSRKKKKKAETPASTNASLKLIASRRKNIRFLVSMYGNPRFLASRYNNSRLPVSRYRNILGPRWEMSPYQVTGFYSFRNHVTRYGHKNAQRPVKNR